MMPAVKIAVGVLSIAAELMTAVREANQVIDEAGEGSALNVLQLRRRLKAEMLLAADAFDVDIEAELAKRSAADDQTSKKGGLT